MTQAAKAVKQPVTARKLPTPDIPAMMSFEAVTPWSENANNFVKIRDSINIG